MASGAMVRAAVAHEHHVRREQGQHAVDVAGHRGVHEGVGDAILIVLIAVDAAMRIADAAAGATGDLAARHRRLADDGGDVGERFIEDVGKQEHGPLERRQPFEQGEEAQRQGVGQCG
jgi:hypothetical protein